MLNTTYRPLSDADFSALLAHHAACYPALCATDVAKLLYQRVYGNGHLLGDRRVGFARLLSELAQCAEHTAPTATRLGGDLCRLSLGAVGQGLSPQTLHLAFCATHHCPGGEPDFLDECRRAADFFAAHDRADLACELRALCAAGAVPNRPPVSHSAAYRQAYHPAYRLVARAVCDALPLLCEIERRLAAGQRCVIAIDGRCGAGKSTLAAMLRTLYGCGIVAMDDFFLPPVRRTAARLSQPGGNLDYERLLDTVVPHLRKSAPFSYVPYLCQSDALGAPRTVDGGALCVLEGSYSTHPLLRRHVDLSVFVTTDPQTQLSRIAARSGRAILPRFVSDWIPLEERYFSAFSSEQHCDFVLG